MELRLDWQQPIWLGGTNADFHQSGLDQIAAVPDDPGVYVFGRANGDSHRPIYIGKASANGLRSRVKQQYNNLKLMRALEAAGNGNRYLSCGIFVARPGQQAGKCIEIIERAMIAWALEHGHELVNIQGARIARHIIRNEGSHHGRWPFDTEIYDTESE